VAEAEADAWGTSSDPAEALAVGAGDTALFPAGGGSDGAGWRWGFDGVVDPESESDEPEEPEEADEPDEAPLVP